VEGTARCEVAPRAAGGATAPRWRRECGEVPSGYRTRVRQAFISVVALVLLAGCGSSSETLTADEYAARADAICAKYKRQTAALGRPTSIPEVAQAADRVLDVVGRARKELGRLAPPPGEAAAVKDWLRAFDVIVADVKTIRDRAKANDLEGVGAVATPALEHNRRATRLARRLGMTVCSSD